MFVSKEELEERFVAAFLVSIDLPVTVERLPAGKGPDFGVRQGDAVIGIELTRVYREDRERGMPYRQAEGIWDQVLAGAHAEWDRLGLPPVTVYARHPWCRAAKGRCAPHRSRTRVVCLR
jgi:hypothetical protein